MEKMKNICREIINPTKKLQDDIYALILILMIRITLYILNYLYIQIDKSYFNLFLIIILIEAIITKYYQFPKIITFIIFISFINDIINLGIIFQNTYSLKDNLMQIFYLLVSIFIHCLTVIILFEAYKEMKAIFIEEYENSKSGSGSESGVELKEYNSHENDK